MLKRTFETCKIIINADDFGISREANRAILNKINEGLVTSVTIIANGPYSNEAISHAKNQKTFSCGVHLNVTAFKSLNPATGYSKFLTESGEYRGDFEKIVNFTDYNRIYDEWRVQVEFLLDKGVQISHIDSHHQLHTRPECFLALKKIQRQFGINRIRRTNNLSQHSKHSALKRKLRNALKAAWVFGIENLPPQTKTTDYFGSLTDLVTFEQRMGSGVFEGKTVEIMCHPGSTGSKWSLDYEAECELLSRGLHTIIKVPHEKINFLHRF